MNQAQREALARDLWAFFITGNPQDPYLDKQGSTGCPWWEEVLPMLEQHLGPTSEPVVEVEVQFCGPCNLHHAAGDHDYPHQYTAADCPGRPCSSECDHRGARPE